MLVEGGGGELELVEPAPVSTGVESSVPAIVEGPSGEMELVGPSTLPAEGKSSAPLPGERSYVREGDPAIPVFATDHSAGSDLAPDIHLDNALDVKDIERLPPRQEEKKDPLTGAIVKAKGSDRGVGRKKRFLVCGVLAVTMAVAAIAIGLALFPPTPAAHNYSPSEDNVFSTPTTISPTTFPPTTISPTTFPPISSMPTPYPTLLPTGAPTNDPTNNPTCSPDTINNGNGCLGRCDDGQICGEYGFFNALDPNDQSQCHSWETSEEKCCRNGIVETGRQDPWYYCCEGIASMVDDYYAPGSLIRRSCRE